MLSDRFYMRDSDTTPKTSVVTWMIAAILASFLIEVVFLATFRSGTASVGQVELTIPALQAGRVWTLLTYGFVHWNASQNLLLVAGVLAGMHYFGSELLPSLGARRLVGLYVGALVLGGLTWAAANWSHPDRQLFGGMAGVYALLTVLACLAPNQDFSFTVFFFPVTLKPKHLALGLALVEFVAFIFYELYGAKVPFLYAPSAHLGGMAAGLIYYRFIHTANWSESPDEEVAPLPPCIARKPVKSSALEPVRAAAGTRDEIRAEVDRILDKINSAGFSALSPAEKRVLDQARDHLTRR